jgi:flagellar hook-associated protein 1 FlgK
MTSGTHVPDVDAALAGFTDDELAFASNIKTGEDIHIWVYDDSEPPVPQRQISVTVTGTMTLRELADAIDSGNTDPDIQADVTSDGRLTIQSTGTSRFAISQDDSDVFAAIGMNTFFSGSDASNIELASAMKGKPELVAASRIDDDGSLTGTAGALTSGDNRGALDIAALQEAALVGDDTAEWAYSTMVGSLGVEASTVYDNAEYQDLVVNELNSQIQSVSGVNLDEEVVRLMEYQWAYEAAARLISTTDEMFQQVFQLVR